LISITKSTCENLLGFSYRFVFEERIGTVLKLMTLTVMHQHLSVVNYQDFGKLLLFAKNGKEDGSKANGAEANDDERVALLLGVNFP
jgi:hypothetical protein